MSAAILRADPIPIFGTGVDGAGMVLADGQVDPHYQLIASPDPGYPGPEVWAINSNTWAIQFDYVPNTTLSRWIGPRADAGNNLPDGFCEQEYPSIDCYQANYVFETTFDLTGLDHTTAVITGRWAMDDSGEMFLNGAPTYIRRSYVYGPNACFRTWADFTLSSGFVPGLNTLTIVVNNRYFPANPDANAIALRVEILSAEADPDTCPEDPVKGNPGQCGCGQPDLDSDGDGVADCVDQCPDDPNKSEPGTCGCGVPDIDSDSDGIFNCNDVCPFDPDKLLPGACGCGVPDDDSDNDAVPDCIDACPADPDKTAPGLCGCGVADTDSDEDGTPDCADLCPGDPLKTNPGVCGCGASDIDGDNDTIPDCIDTCPADPDTDSDLDGVLNCQDGCPADAIKTSPGVCGCGQADADGDADGVPDCLDLCPGDPAKLAPGACGCGTADTDSDADGLPDCRDACPEDPGKIAPGVCGCGQTDQDADQDGVMDCLDACPDDATKIEPGLCGCGQADTDSDGDGVPDCEDGCPDDPHKSSPGACGCGAVDTDFDGDGTFDCNDYCPKQPWKAEPGYCGCTVPDTDSDGDGLPDCVDGCPEDPNKTSPGIRGCGVADPPPIPTLFGTGVGPDGNVLPDGAVDPHYALIISPDPDYPGPAALVMNQGSPPLQGGYVPNNTTSRWISPRADGGNNLPNGQCEEVHPSTLCHNAFYHYRTTFDLTDFDFSTVVILARWACDDSAEIFLNGASTGILRPQGTGENAAFRTFQEFMISSGFVSGINTLDFVVRNNYVPGGSPVNATGLRVDILSATGDLLPDVCPDDPNKRQPGQCGCGVADTDGDGDGTADCVDGCPEDPARTSPGACGCGQADTDADADGVPDCSDACPASVPGALVDPTGCSNLRGDFDRDGDVDADDLATLRSCVSGPSVPHNGSATCQKADADADNDVDQTDFGLWQRCYSGTGVAADPACAL